MMGIWNGNQYAMPFTKKSNGSILNVDMFKEAGIEVPKNMGRMEVSSRKS